MSFQDQICYFDYLKTRGVEYDPNTKQECFENIRSRLFMNKPYSLELLKSYFYRYNLICIIVLKQGEMKEKLAFLDNSAQILEHID